MEFRDVTTDPRFTHLDDVMFVLAADNTWLHLAPAWYDLSGFTVSESQGQPITRYWHPADRPRLLEFMEHLRQYQHTTPHKTLFTGRCLTATGEIRHLDMVVSQQPANSTDRQLEHLFGILRPATPALARASTQPQTERMQRVVDHMPCMVACLSRDLHITFANTAYASNFSVPVEQVVGKSLFSILHPSQHITAREHLTALSKYNPQHVFEHWVNLPNGEQRYQRWTDYVFFDNDGRISEYQTVGIDLTQRKSVEDKLRQSENQFRSLVESSVDIVFMVNTAREFIYLSPQVHTLLGYAPTDVLGIVSDALVHEDDIRHTQDNIQAVLMGKPQVESCVYRAKHADGSWRWYATRGAAIKDTAGNIIGAVGIARDITTTQHDEQALRDSLKQLEHALANNTMLLREVHHRVKNNLQIISSLLNLQARRLEDDHAKHALQASRSRVMAMAEIHTMMYQHEQADKVMFDDYLHSLIDRIKHAYGILGITFAVRGDNLALPADQAIPLGLMVNELLTNAVKYAFPWPEPTQQPLSAPTVTITIQQDTDALILTVQDNGIGMPEEVHAMTSEATNASLGMTIVHSLTSQLGGTVTFSNHASGGLQVTVHVPMALS